MSHITYKLKIKGLQTPDGTISIQRLREILDFLLECSERSLRLAVQGESVKRARKPGWLSQSLDFTVVGLERSSTALALEVPMLGETAAEQIQQQDFWYTTPSPTDTALTLLYRAVRDTTSESLESTTYDAGVLDSLLSFEPFLKQCAQQIELDSYDRPQERFVLGALEIESVRRLKISTPEPMAFVVSGQFDMIQHSNRRFHILLSNGQSIPGTVDTEFLHVEDMREWWGKKVTIKGMVHFHPSRKVRLMEAHVIKSMDSGEEVFDRVPVPTTMELFDFARRQPLNGSPLMEVWGTWPGDESIEEILAALKE